MKKVIWKFDLDLDREFTIELPKGAQILKIDTQLGAGRMWALVDSTAATELRKFEIHGTGNPFDATNREYIGSWITNVGNYVWHLFEVK